MPTIANEDVVQTVGVQQIAVAGHGKGSRSVEAVTTASVENDVHLTAFPAVCLQSQEVRRICFSCHERSETF